MKPLSEQPFLMTLIASTKDEASINIRNNLLKKDVFIKTENLFHDAPIYTHNDFPIQLVTIDVPTIFAENIDQELKTPLIVFLSKHSAESGIPSFTVHTPGNWKDATAGGKARTICRGIPYLELLSLRALTKYTKQHGLEDKFQVSYEATHHGPELNHAQAMFIELGSTKKEWEDPSFAAVVADALIEALEQYFKNKEQEAQLNIAIGIGGRHYNEKFTNISLQTNFAFPHLIPKYHILDIDADLLQQIFQKTPNLKYFIFDHKGTNAQQRKHIKELLEHTTIKIEILKDKDILRKPRIS